MVHTSQKLAAEFLGTFALVFFGSGAICAERFVTGAGGGALGIALATGLAAAISYIAFSRFSGGHFNPAISIGLWVTKRLNTVEVAGYWAAQLAGAVIAALLLRALLPREEAFLPSLGGTPVLFRDFARLPAMCLEAVITFVLVLVFFAVTSDEFSEFRTLAGGAVGLLYTLGILVANPFTGAALNPARAFGPALAASHWKDQGVFWVGPLAGGFLAGLVYDALFAPKDIIPAP